MSNKIACCLSCNTAAQARRPCSASAPEWSSDVDLLMARPRSSVEPVQVRLVDVPVSSLQTPSMR
eukprot:18936-Rhodomonas_salina.1